MRELTVVGSINVDLVVQGERLPEPGETVIGGTFRRSPGGKGANQAVAAAALGVAVRFEGCVGEDEHGAWLRSELRARGVDSAGLRTVEAPTGVALILVDAQGENVISVASGANEELRARGEYDLLLTQLETPYSRPTARTLILNPAPARSISVEGVDWLLPNEVEAEQLSGENTLERQHAALLAAGARQVVITLGARGVYDGQLHPAFEVDAVDTVGAGDTFAGAFAAALAEGHSDPLRFAQAAAALAVTRVGAQSGPDRSALEVFLAER